MAISKRTTWTEDDVLAMPAGEHDYFDRKSGSDFSSDRGHFLDIISKALSAFANSGGGHLILGMQDDGSFDGLPPVEGRARTREWLEQKIPVLLAYELQDFRVHEVVPSTPSAIPEGKIVIVIDVGDSALAPHQASRGSKAYYFRQGGHSQIAPHHYLELLRQRLVGPTLALACEGISVQDLYTSVDNQWILPLSLRFTIRNTGRIAAYKWELYANTLNVPDGKSIGDYHFRSLPNKQSQGMRMGTIPIGDNSILPGRWRSESESIGIVFAPDQRDYLPSYYTEVGSIAETTVNYRVATEVSPGEDLTVRLGDFFDVDAVAHGICSTLGVT